MIAIFRKRPAIPLVLGGLALAAGILSAYYLPRIRQKAAILAKEPQRITLNALATNGAGENPHVIVTDFVCGNRYVFEMQKRKGAPVPQADETGYGKAWIPLFPRTLDDLGENPPRSFIVLLETTPTVASGNGFHILSRQQSMEGLAMALSSRPLSPEVRSKLTEYYPDTDFNNCLNLVQFERYEREDVATFANVVAFVTGGGLLIGIPLFLVGIIFLVKRSSIVSEVDAGRS